ncbi:hypothetical protein DdX_18248 [Ditylenchus destructor]|uniref:Uncharacterized protein n=1 Tax=Ditylenchus destructor TaxID=166010 RepID=A0AAD4QV25_9BILA|nr:hypothetical protein DdX_18248 [Ditylenchus destructor]
MGQVVNLFKRDYAEFMVKEKRHEDESTEQIFEFVNADIGKKLQLAGAQNAIAQLNGAEFNGRALRVNPTNKGAWIGSEMAKKTDPIRSPSSGSTNPTLYLGRRTRRDLHEPNPVLILTSGSQRAKRAETQHDSRYIQERYE